MKWVNGKNGKIHSFLFPKNLKFSFASKLEGIKSNEIGLIKFLLKLPKCINIFVLK